MNLWLYTLSGNQNQNPIKPVNTCSALWTLGQFYSAVWPFGLRELYTAAGRAVSGSFIHDFIELN